jgi:hypothetical protein
MNMRWDLQMILILQGASAFMIVQNLMTLLLYTGTYLVTGMIPGYWIWGGFMLSLYGFGFVQAALFFMWAVRGAPVPRAYLADTTTVILAVLSAAYWYLIQPIALNAWLGQYYLPVIGVDSILLIIRGVLYVRSREVTSPLPARA